MQIKLLIACLFLLWTAGCGLLGGAETKRKRNNSTVTAPQDDQEPDETGPDNSPDGDQDKGEGGDGAKPKEQGGDEDTELETDPSLIFQKCTGLKLDEIAKGPEFGTTAARDFCRDLTTINFLSSASEKTEPADLN